MNSLISRNEASQANQTEFIDQVPILERRSSKLLSLRDLRHNKNLLPFYLLVGLFFLVVILLLLRVVLQVRPEEPKPMQAQQAPVELSPLQKRVYDLREELRSNDPTKQSTPFPQVDLKFSIN